MHSKTASVYDAGVGPPLAPFTFTPKSPSGPPGLWLADRMIPPMAFLLRIRWDAAGGDDYFPQPMGGCHAQDHIDGTHVAVTTVAANHQSAAISTWQGAECGFDEAFEVVRLFKLLAAFAQARGAWFLIGERDVEMNLTLGRFRRGCAGHLNGYCITRNLNPRSQLSEVEPTS